MNINLSFASRTPIYEQVVNEIERLVTLEILKPDEQIMSIRELACSLGINPNTVKKAYDILESKGIIVTKSTKGTFISHNIEQARQEKVHKIFTNIQELIKELAAYGVTKEEVIKKIK